MSYQDTVSSSFPLRYFRLHPQVESTVTDTCVMTGLTGNLVTGTVTSPSLFPYGTKLSVTQSGIRFVSSSLASMPSYRIPDFTSSLFLSASSTTAPRARFQVDYTSSLDFDLSSSFSAEFWLLCGNTGSTTSKEYVGRYIAPGGTPTGMILYSDATNTFLYYGWFSGTNIHGVVWQNFPGLFLSGPTWKHIVWTYSGSSTASPLCGSALYVNAEKQTGNYVYSSSPASWGSATIRSGNVPWSIGMTGGENVIQYEPVNEYYAEFAMYNRALSASEVSDHYYSSFANYGSTTTSSLTCSILLTSSFDIQKSTTFVQKMTNRVEGSTTTGGGSRLGMNTKTNPGTN